MVTIKITDLFGANLATLLADKIKRVYGAFDDAGFIHTVDIRTKDMTYTRRIEIIAEELRNFLPAVFALYKCHPNLC